MPEKGPPTDVDDADLALRITEKDEAALATVLEVYGPKVKGFLRSRFGEVLDDADRESVYYQVAMKVWQHAGDYRREKGTLGGWFVRIARNTAISYIRGEERHCAAPLDQDPADDCDDASPVVDDTDRQRLDRLDDFIRNKLTGIERTVALNCFTVGGDADSVRLAEKLGKTRGYIDTVKSKVKKKIREAVLALEAEEDGRKDET